MMCPLLICPHAGVDTRPAGLYQATLMKHVAAILLACCVLTGCGKTPQATSPPPPPVNFAVAKTEDVPLQVETFGNCSTVANVTLQAQVTGNLLKFVVAQGAVVQAGDVIAEIDPAPYQAALKEAEGTLESAKAKLVNAQLTLERQTGLFKTKTIDLADLQTAQVDALDAQGAVQAAEGEVEDAQINLGYCTIKTPIAGKAGLYAMDAGNLVTANQTQIINIQTIDPIYVDFTISENEFGRVRSYFAKGELPVEVAVPGSPGEVLTGKLTFLNNNIASETGTLSLQATLANDKQTLWPGLFVNVRLILTTLKDAVVIPAPCVMVGQAGPYAFVIRQDKTVEQRNLTVGEQLTDWVVITEGIQAGDQVVTAGQLGLVTGKAVNPVAWNPPTK
ncbi:MAG: efflux RND transporter periplasmic adaptor subunit [Terrimicrobiaceae bacterium]